MATNSGRMIRDITAAVYRFPTERPESDGTFSWDATTAVTVTVTAGSETGLGWTYSTAATAQVVTDHLAPAIAGRDAFDLPGCWSAMHRACRNLGTSGVVMQGISAMDIALWDLKARILGVSMTQLLGRERDTVPVYGSGGFTNLTDDELADQVAGWSDAGCRAMKIKIGQSWGTDVQRDLVRVHTLRDLAGPEVDLMVDANGAYPAGQARRVGAVLDELCVVWFEEPVSSDDLAGLSEVRSALECDVAAGEYVDDIYAAARLLPVVDCLQLDVTRCGGYTGFIRAASVAQAHNLQVSGHCAPALHAPVAAAIPNLRHVEWFIDHARLEPLLVDGAAPVRDGALVIDDSGIGHGMTVSNHAAPYRT